MGIALTIFYLYKITSNKNEEKNVLIRCMREEFYNHNQIQEDLANQKVEFKKETLLNNYIDKNFRTTRKHLKIDFLGQMQVDTFGDELYEDSNKELTIYIADTAYKFPWIAIGQANSKEGFTQKMNDDDIYDTEIGILSLNPKVETLRQLKVELITASTHGFTILD